MTRRSYMVALLAMGLFGCSEVEEAPEYEVEIFADGSGLLPVQTEQGVMVTVERIEFWIEGVEFTVGGDQDHEAQASLWRRLLLPEAQAHPGHGVGGEVAGELLGPLRVVLRPSMEEPLGTGTFLGGDYGGYNLAFSLMDDQGAPLEHHVVISGVVQDLPEGSEQSFEARLHLFPGAEVRGGAFTGRVPDVEALGLRIVTFDEWSETTLFDGVDFSNLPEEEGTLIIRGTTATGATLLNRFLAHEFYDARVRDL